MEQKYTILIAVLVVISILIGTVFFQFNQWKKDSYESTYTYELDIYTDRTEIGFSMIIPLPLKDGIPPIDEETFSTEFDRQENWSAKFINTEYGKMLLVNGTFTSERHDININVNFDARIETKDAIDKEPTLRPKENMTKSTYDDPHPEEWDERIDAYEYSSYIFLQFEDDVDIELSINIRFEGRNEWWVLGWSGNEYFDRVYSVVNFDGPRWYKGDGKIVDGLGNYD